MSDDDTIISFSLIAGPRGAIAAKNYLQGLGFTKVKISRDLGVLYLTASKKLVEEVFEVDLSYRGRTSNQDYERSDVSESRSGDHRKIPVKLQPFVSAIMLPIPPDYY